MKVNKTKRIEEILLSDSEISNIKTLEGAYGFRTNRLGAYICNLRLKYKIDTHIIKDITGDYMDCIYKLKGKL